MDPVEEAIRKINEMEDPYTTPVAEAMVYLMSLSDASEPRVIIETVTSVPRPTVSKDFNIQPVGEPLPVKVASTVEVGMLSVEGWAGSAALLLPIGTAALVSTRAIQSVHLEPDYGALVLRRKNESSFVLPKSRLVCWEAEGPLQRAIWHVYGNFERTTKGYDSAFEANEPFAKVSGPVLVRLFWAREGSHATTGDLAPKSALVERLGLLTGKGPEYTLAEP